MDLYEPVNLFQARNRDTRYSREAMKWFFRYYYFVIFKFLLPRQKMKLPRRNFQTELPRQKMELPRRNFQTELPRQKMVLNFFAAN